MKLSEEGFERIDNYLLDRLSPNEKKIFELEIETNSEFAKEVEIRKAIIEQINIVYIEKVAEEILEEKRIKSKNSIQIFLKKQETWWALAASISILIIFSWHFLPNLFVKEDKLIVETLQRIPESYKNIQPRDNNPGMTGNNPLENELTEAYKFFKEEKYIFCIPILERYLEKNKNDYEVHFVLALSYLQIGNNMQALSNLKILEKQSLFSERAEVLLKLSSLHLLKKQNEGKICNWLDEVAEIGTNEQKQLSKNLGKLCD